MIKVRTEGNSYPSSHVCERERHDERARHVRDLLHFVRRAACKALLGISEEVLQARFCLSPSATRAARTWIAVVLRYGLSSSELPATRRTLPMPSREVEGSSGFCNDSKNASRKL